MGCARKAQPFSRGEGIRYLYVIARNLCIEESKRRKCEELPEDIADEEDGEEALIQKLHVRQALDCLPEEDRELLILRYVNEESVANIYKNKIAVDRLSFCLERGVTGLLGANGAGKTTLMRMLCGILTPTSGDVTYDGMPVSEEGYRIILGYLPQDFGYYP